MSQFDYQSLREGEEVTGVPSQAEVDGLNRFIETLRHEALATEVPTDRILAKFREKIAEEQVPVAPITAKKQSFTFLWLVPAAAAVFVAGFLLRGAPATGPALPLEQPVVLDLGRGPFVQKVETNAFTVAMSNVKASLKEAPSLDIQFGRVVRSNRGTNWGCVDYLIDGQQYCVSVQPLPGCFHKLRDHKGCKIKPGEGVGVVAGKYGIWVEGGTEDMRLKIAETLAIRTSKPAEQIEPQKL